MVNVIKYSYDLLVFLRPGRWDDAQKNEKIFISMASWPAKIVFAL